MRKKTTIAGFIIFFSIISATLSFYFWQVLFGANLQYEKEDKYLFIPEGAIFQTVLDSLEAGEFIHNYVAFRFVCRAKGYKETIYPGRYLIPKNASNRDVVNMLKAGRQTPVTLVFNNVRKKEDLAEKVSTELMFTSDELLDLLNDRKFLTQYGFDSLSVSAMFIPDTYEIFWNVTSEAFFERMHKEYNKFWSEERLKKAEAIGLTPTEVSVLASITESETNRADEKPRIAGVFLNRLKNDMLLEADPTLKFALNNFELKRILNVHKEVDSPFNTYKYKGLPPGPITIPSVESIDAVLDAETHNYLYFCARPDDSGYHIFEKTAAAHKKNAELYHTRLNKRML